MTFDFSKLEHHPLLLEHNGRQAIAIDFGAYAQMGFFGRNRFENELDDLLKDNYFSPEKREQISDILERGMDAAKDGKLILVENGGGAYIPTNSINLLMFDSRVITFDNYIAAFSDSQTVEELDAVKSKIRFNIDEHQEEILDRFIQHHEGGHFTMNDVHRGGANEEAPDYMAAVQTLRDFPDARETLLFYADLRMMQSLLIEPDPDETRNPMRRVHQVINKYGYENYLAMRSVLTLSDEEIAQMDDLEMISNAREFNVFSDSLAFWNRDDGVSAKPAHKLHADLRKDHPDINIQVNGAVMSEADIMASSDLTAIKELVTALQGKGLYPEGSLEAQMLDDFAESIDRMTESGYYTFKFDDPQNDVVLPGVDLSTDNPMTPKQ